MGKKAELAEMAEMTKMAEDSGDQTAAAERMEMDAMEKRQDNSFKVIASTGDYSITCDPGWKSRTDMTCKDYEDNNWCTQDRMYGTGWKDEFNTFEFWASNERSALVCPQCGCKDPGRPLCLREVFMIEKKANCENAEKLCQSKKARLARFNIQDYGVIGPVAHGDQEMERLREYLFIQYDYSTITKNNTRFWDFWVSGTRKAGVNDKGLNVSDLLGNYISFYKLGNKGERAKGPGSSFQGQKPCNQNKFPVCEKV